MRAATFVGSINNGDTVEVPGPIGKNGIVVAQRVRNLSSSATVTAGPAEEETEPQATAKAEAEQMGSFAKLFLILVIVTILFFVLKAVAGL